MTRQEFEEQVRELYPEGGGWVHLEPGQNDNGYKPSWGFLIDTPECYVLISHNMEIRPSSPWTINVRLRIYHARLPEEHRAKGATLDEARANSLLACLDT